MDMLSFQHAQAWYAWLHSLPLPARGNVPPGSCSKVAGEGKVVTDNSWQQQLEHLPHPLMTDWSVKVPAPSRQISFPSQYCPKVLSKSLNSNFQHSQHQIDATILCHWRHRIPGTILFLLEKQESPPQSSFSFSWPAWFVRKINEFFLIASQTTDSASLETSQEMIA